MVNQMISAVHNTVQVTWHVIKQAIYIFLWGKGFSSQPSLNSHQSTILNQQINYFSNKQWMNQNLMPSDKQD